MNFNHEELMLMMLYNTGTRMGLIHELRLMQCYLMQELLKQNPAPNKERHQMEWVQHMNSLKAQAEELVMNELIYS